MKIKIIFSFLSLMASILSCNAINYNGTCGNNVSWSLNLEDSTLTISGFGEMINYNHNSSATGYSPWYNRKDIKAVVISDSITNVGFYSFYKCGNLESVHLGDSIIEIGCGAFYQCPALKIVNIPQSVKAIDWSAFSGCTSLQNIVLHDSIEDLGNYVFADCSELSQIHFPVKLKTIRMGAFRGCVKFTQMPMGENVTCIEAEAFKNCHGLTNIIIPKHVTSIGSNAFYYCKNITDITLHDSITNIGGSAFRFCEKLSSITLPNKIDTIWGYMFTDCSSLTKLTIGNNTKYLGRGVFANCYKLKDITCRAVVPPALHGEAFINFSRFYTILRVPIRSMSTYLATEIWKDFIIQGYCMVTISSNDESMGYVIGKQGEMEQYTTISLNARANPGYKFIQWSDGNTDNPRSVYVSDDIELSAIFAPKEKFTLSVTCDSEQGYIEGESGEYEEGTSHTFHAIPNIGYRFDKWTDEVFNNPRIVLLTQDTIISALFIRTFTVRFFDNTETLISEQIVDKGKNAIAPTPPIVENFVFVGWDKDFTNVQEDIDVYAQYEPSGDGVENIQVQLKSPYMIINNGQIYILRGDKTYTITGAEVE